MVAQLRTHNRFSFSVADEALRDAVAFGLPLKLGELSMPKNATWLLKIVGQVVRPGRDAAAPHGHAFADAPAKRSRMRAWRIVLGLGPRSGSRAWRMKTDALGVQWSTATKTKAGPSATATVAVKSVPHITWASGDGPVVTPSCDRAGSLDTHLCYAAWRSSYSSRASIGV